jgi:hypothetical protein
MMQIEKGSFRDPSGSIFYEQGQVFRQVSESYTAHYQHLMSSGLYAKLVEKKLLIPHVEVAHGPLVLKPERIPFISYPHEWSFSQLKEAALVTLEIQTIATEYGMQLKDASAYNMQFRQGKAILIDTLSFEVKTDSIPWIAYRQFCQHFLGPLAVRAYVDWRLKNLALTHIDGPPLDLVVRLLPLSQLLRPSLLIHLVLHSKFQNNPPQKHSVGIAKPSKTATQALISSLKSAVSRIQWKFPQTLWQDYRDETSYSIEAFHHKELIIKEYLSSTQPEVVWDLGANEGHFSQLAKEFAKEVVSLDGDPVCIDRLFNKKTSILPLLMDLSTPTPSFGWGEGERKSLSERGPADLLMALALIHHLYISGGIPFVQIAEYFSKLCHHLIVEFIPLEDKKIIQMNLENRIHEDTYNESAFQSQFSKYFKIKQRNPITGSGRILFLMETIKETLCHSS